MNDILFVEKLAKIANEYCKIENTNEDEIDKFIEYVYRTHCKIDLLMLRGVL